MTATQKIKCQILLARIQTTDTLFITPGNIDNLYRMEIINKGLADELEEEFFSNGIQAPELCKKSDDTFYAITGIDLYGNQVEDEIMVVEYGYVKELRNGQWVGWIEGEKYPDTDRINQAFDVYITETQQIQTIRTYHRA